MKSVKKYHVRQKGEKSMTTDKKFEMLMVAVTDISQNMVKIDGRLDKIEQKMVKVEGRLDKIEHRMATEMVTKTDLDVTLCDVQNGILTEVDRVQEFSIKLHDETKRWIEPMNIKIQTNKSTTDLLSNRLHIIENDISNLQNLFS